MPETYPLLESIESPEDLRKLSAEKLVQLAGELRSFLLDTVAKTGGHLSSNLGTVELTVALHYVFNTPQDKLVWDVGHQTYPHKILTGRRDSMGSLRSLGGLSGFPKPSESPYDTFSAGHAATSISAALGMAEAAHCQSRDDRVVAIIGDGAMTAGMAFEAMNHAGDIKRNLLVILNDNEMSISKPVGALSKYLTRVLSGPTYNAARRAGERVLSHAPSMLEIAQRLEEHVKGMVTPGTLFEAFGFNYLGPIDGHNVGLLIQTLTNLKSLPGPQLLHVLTRKGQGYKLAEADPILYHGVTRFDHENGLAAAKTSVTFTQTFGDWLCDMAAKDDRLVGITPAMETGSGLGRFAELYPNRYHDVGIAEQHALTFAAGLATQGMKPVVAIYSTFLQRAYDQLIHDIALQNLPVMLAIDRGGLVGADGPTHHGSFDLSFLSCVPNLVIATPADENECRHLLSTAYAVPGPSAVRYPRGGSGQTFVAENFDISLTALPLGRGEIRRAGKKVAFLAFGPCLYDCLAAAESLEATVANMRFVKPLDDELVADLAARHKLLVSVEDNSVMGGAGAQVALSLQRLDKSCQLLQIGLPDVFIEHGDQKVLRGLVGLDAKGIVSQVEAHLKTINNTSRDS